MASSNVQARKIKPVQRPGLFLKTPIAYHGGSDLSVLPIDKDGIAVCEKCGAIGVKHAFYTRQRKFCSVTCARGYSGFYNSQKENDANGNVGEEGLENGNTLNYYGKQANYRFKLMESTEHLAGMIPMEPLPRLPPPWIASAEDFLQPPPVRGNGPLHSHDYGDELFGCDFLAAPVKLFGHAPLSDMWDTVLEGMKVEVKNKDCEKFSLKLSDFFWVATVLKLKGYMGLLRYEGFGSDDSKDFWVNLMCSEVHPVGWCATRGKPLIPPISIENKYSDWKMFLVRQLTGARTLPTDFYNKISESLKSRFRLGHVLEVVDKNRISQVKVATVYEIVGKRLHIRYYDSSPEDNGFWCHEDSPLIHPVGWARAVGHLLDAPDGYCERLDAGEADVDDATVDLFKYYVNRDPHNINFEPEFVEGMKLEAIDPLNLSSICVATVMRVLLLGYIMIRIDCYPPDEAGADWFCYHERSPCIFPAGYCQERGIPLTVAAGQAPLPPPLPAPAPPTVPMHGFVAGMRLECVDLMDPRLVCVATVARIVGRLLKIHFDGWGDEYDQWLDCESTDMYPVGWSRAVRHKLEAPFVPARPPPPASRKRGRKKKGAKLPTEPSKSINNVTTEVPEIPVTDPHDNDKRDNDNHDNRDNVNLNNHMGDSENLDNDDHDLHDNDTEMSIFDDMSTIKDEMEHFDVEAPEMEEAIKLESPKMPSLENILDERQHDLELDNNLSFDMGDIDAKSPFDSADVDDCLATDAMDIVSTLDDIPDILMKPKISKVIPRLVGNVHLDPSVLSSVDPETWDTDDVAEFLTANDCAPHCIKLCQVTGKAMLELTKEQILDLLQGKVGPSVKIYDLIQQLKCKLKRI